MRLINTITSHLRIHWKLITFITIFWSLINFGLLCLPFMSERFSIAYGSLIKNTSNSQGLSGSGSMEMIPLEMIYNILFKNLGWVIYGMIIIIFINKILLKEISSTQISLWLTQPISKAQIILAKYLTLILIITFLYLPAFVILISIASFGHDSKVALSNVTLGGLQTYFFLLMLASIFFIVALLLIERTMLFNIIGSLILTYFTLIGLLELITLISVSENEALKIIINYIGLQVFISNVLPPDFDKEPVSYLVYETIENGENIKIFIETPALKDINIILYCISTILMNGLLLTFGWLSTYLFKNISFNI
ncbi:ABC transporter permease subunit [Spiroplasma endosymbiont of Cantharis rufa]|uniref:ABC transporter permease subunit n=1 Tax=Spiroplasma endosymbiont of Cantharis rufa TaxID=3066279 RepID=UPI0030D50052